jgi:hypothetical protein
MDNMKCAVAPQPKEFPNVRDFICMVEGQQETIESIANSLLVRLNGSEPTDGNKKGDENCLSRLEEISKRNEEILEKLRKISDCI